MTDGQVRREALAVHLAAPLRRRKSTFEHEPYGAAYIAVHRAHEMILVLDDQREAKEYSEAEEDRHDAIHRRCSKRLDLSAIGRSSARLPSLEHFAPSLSGQCTNQATVQCLDARGPARGDQGTPIATISVLFYVFVP